MVYRALYSYRQRVRVVTLFPRHFFRIVSVCWAILQKFFERKVWRVQVANLHNVARALSSPSRCFQLSTNLGKDFVIFDIVIKKNRMWVSVALVNFHWFGINWHSENRATRQIWKLFPNMVFPPIWGEKMASSWACAYKLSWTLLSSARVEPLYGAGKKGEFRDWTN